jgi:cell division protein FtsI (penicillin-binding protein 3)
MSNKGAGADGSGKAVFQLPLDLNPALPKDGANAPATAAGELSEASEGAAGLGAEARRAAPEHAKPSRSLPRIPLPKLRAPKISAPRIRAPKIRLPKLAMPSLSSLMRTTIGKSGVRIRFVAAGFAALYLAIGGKLVYLGAKPNPETARRAAAEASSRARPDILDRRGMLLATDIKISSVFAEPRRIVDKDEAVDRLLTVFPDLDTRELEKKIRSRRGFVWIKRGIDNVERKAVFNLGLPGVGFLPEYKRVYPNGRIGAHVLGATNTDNIGIAGLERYIDTLGLADLTGAGFRVSHANLKPIRVSLDVRATHAVRDEVQKGIIKFKAKAGAAAIMDVNTGEIIALASLPDFDPNNPVDALKKNNINRMSVGVYEMGSTFKALTLAMALDARHVRLNTSIDARHALRYGRFKIRDFHAQARALKVTEVFTYSSNIGTARLALMSGVKKHQDFLRKLGQLDRMRTELPESARPIVPRKWGELNTMTIAFGHGLAVAPLQSMMAVSALVNGGYLVKPTFLYNADGAMPADTPRVLREQTSEQLRYIMRLNAEVGSARKIDVKGYFAGGKTGTANKVINGRYAQNVVFNTFTAIVPSDKPKYLFLTIYDEPQGIPETHGYRTAAWNAGYVTGKIIERVSPILGLPPAKANPDKPFPMVASGGMGLPSNGRKWR